MDNYQTLKNKLDLECQKELADLIYQRFENRNLPQNIKSYLISTIQANKKVGLVKNKKFIGLRYDEKSIMDLPENSLYIISTSLNITEDAIEELWLQIGIKEEIGYVGIGKHGIGLEPAIIAATVGYMSQGIPLEDVKVYTPTPLRIENICNFSLGRNH